MRNLNLPIATLDSIRSAAKIEQVLMLLLQDEPELMLLIKENGAVFAVDIGSQYVNMACEERPDWIIGVYNRSAEKGDIMKDVQARRMELSEVLAC